MIEFVIARQRHQRAETGSEGKVNLLCRLNPNIDVQYLQPLWIKVILDAKPGALKENPAY